MNRLRLALVLALCLPAAACRTPPEAARDSVARGRAVAQRYCAGCHVVSRDQRPAAGSNAPRPSWASAPSFMEVAEYPNVDRAYLRGLATEFYFPMPAFHLADADREDVISYILSLKGQL
jgi:mono/diheme cytochrome c family protein